MRILVDDRAGRVQQNALPFIFDETADLADDCYSRVCWQPECAAHFFGSPRSRRRPDAVRNNGDFAGSVRPFFYITRPGFGVRDDRIGQAKGELLGCKKPYRFLYVIPNRISSHNRARPRCQSCEDAYGIGGIEMDVDKVYLSLPNQSVELRVRRELIPPPCAPIETLL